MAHFAELDANNVVLRVIVVGNADTSDASGVEKNTSVRHSAKDYLVALGSKHHITVACAFVTLA